MSRPGFEPGTPSLEGWCSIQLSYQDVLAFPPRHIAGRWVVPPVFCSDVQALCLTPGTTKTSAGGLVPVTGPEDFPCRRVPSEPMAAVHQLARVVRVLAVRATHADLNGCGLGGVGSDHPSDQKHRVVDQVTRHLSMSAEGGSRTPDLPLTRRLFYH